MKSKSFGELSQGKKVTFSHYTEFGILCTWDGASYKVWLKKWRQCKISKKNKWKMLWSLMVMTHWEKNNRLILSKMHQHVKINNPWE